MSSVSISIGRMTVMHAGRTRTKGTVLKNASCLPGGEGDVTGIGMSACVSACMRRRRESELDGQTHPRAGGPGIEGRTDERDRDLVRQLEVSFEWKRISPSSVPCLPPSPCYVEGRKGEKGPSFFYFSPSPECDRWRRRGRGGEGP